jgi:DNA invertase Pin-like site-specific DNA recombinase
MNGSIKVLPAHLKRRAVVYLRQSDPKQVRENRESAVNQRALTERLRELTWKPEQIVVVDGDQGVSAKHAEGRPSFQKLVADVGLGKIGIIIGYEVSRLARNNADWHRLLELCALFDTLIGDSDGIYHPRDFNDRLLLGLKGTMSEAELHSLRLRLDAGRLSKAKRGELIQHLPTGLVRNVDGSVAFDPDASIEQRIRLVFTKFVELGSGSKVLTYLVRNHLKLPRRQTSGLYAGQVLWKEPALAALHSILKNPAYAGAFAHGRRSAEPTKQIPGRPAAGRLRRPQSQWQALVQDVYPAYITWDEYERIQRKIAENRQKMDEQFTRKGGVRHGAALLAGLVRCGRCGHAMVTVYKGTRFQYRCNRTRSEYGKPSCQFLSGQRIDAVVVEEFFRAIAPAQIDALEKVSRKQRSHHREQIRHLKQEMKRLEYAAARAERQYDSVDPENRLIAATLEKKWEQSLLEFETAKSQLSETEATTPQAVAVPIELRESFADIGGRLPELWPRLSVEARKSLLRTLVERVNLLRDEEGVCQIRIVWRGGSVTETRVQVPVHSLRYSEAEKQVAARIGQLTAQGKRVQEIIDVLNSEAFRPCRGGAFTPQIVNKLKHRYHIVSNLEQLRQGNTPSNAYTIKEMAQLIEIDPSWFYRKIRKGSIRIKKDPLYGCYLFPRTKQSIAQLKQLNTGKLPHVTFPKVHHDG